MKGSILLHLAIGLCVLGVSGVLYAGGAGGKRLEAAVGQKLGVPANDLRYSCAENCGAIGNNDLRYLCDKNCGAISDNGLRYYCQDNCGAI